VSASLSWPRPIYAVHFSSGNGTFYARKDANRILTGIADFVSWYAFHHLGERALSEAEALEWLDEFANRAGCQSR